MKLVPKRRFEGFKEPWEKRKLGEILRVNSGRDYKHLPKGDIPVYGTGGYMLSVDDNLSDVDGIGIGRKGTIDKPLYLKAPFWTVDTLFFLTPILNCDLYYFYLTCQKVNWRAMDESTGVPSLSKNTIENIPLRVAKLDEQQKIGSFFRKLDKRIAKQEAKVEKLQAIKQAYLHEMFPAEGESVPKRRFGGFTREWKEQKLGAILQVNSGKDYKHLQKGDIPVYGTGGYMLSVDDNLSDVDGIGIGRKGTIDKPLYLEAPFWTVDTLFFLTPLIKCDLYYFYLLCQKVNWKAMDASTGVPSLSKNSIENIALRVAKLEEQQKIGSFFRKLDKRIAKQEEKVEKLKAMKQAYLHEMFV